jgi:Tfp pilus assembly protein PilO
MTDASHGAALVRRVGNERRRVIVGLGVALVINAIVYGIVVRPLSQKVANVAQRNETAERALAAAEREHAAAAGTLTGKDRAAAELATFYTDVLPSDLAGARRLTHLRLAQLARQSNLRFERAVYEPVVDRSSTLTRLKIELVLAGTYSDMRVFIHQLETAPEFVVIDNVELAEGADRAGSLVVTLELSTYYREATK